MPLLTLTPIANGDDVDAVPVMADLNAIKSLLNGGLDDVNVAVAAGISGLKLSNVPGSRVPGDRLDDDAVDGRVLKNDPTAGHANAAVNDPDHVKDGILNGLKTTANTVGADRLRLGYADKALGTINGGVLNEWDTGVSVTGNASMGTTIRRAGGAGAVGAVIFQVYANTTSNTYYVAWWNPTAVPINASGFTLRFHYLPVAST